MQGFSSHFDTIIYIVFFLILTI